MTSDRRDFRGPSAHVTISENDGYVTIARGNTEAQIRTALASLAYLYGWEVQEEVVVPGWGRIDIVLRDGVSMPVLVELKIDLTKPARIRKAVQQADGYGRWWIDTKHEQAEVKLVGVDVDSVALAPVASAYHSVHCMAVGLFIGFLETGGPKTGRDKRALRMRSRLAEAERLVALHRAAEVTMRREVEARKAMFDGFEMFEGLVGAAGEATA